MKKRRTDGLAPRYGPIEIPAIAAAARYQDKSKKKETAQVNLSKQEKSSAASNKDDQSKSHIEGRPGSDKRTG
jgi:hypothetical protein